MLEQNKEMLIAKIIGLLNGLDGEGVKFKEEDILKKALNAIKNNQSLDEYIAFFEEKKKEYFLLGFRKIDGVSILEYKRRFNSDPLLDFDFQKLISEGLIYINKDRICLTEKGIMLANDVFMEFV